jgi:hypothetical protein
MFTLIRLLPMGDCDKDAEILALRHQLAVLQRQTDKPKLTWPDRALLAALLHRLPRVQLHRLQLIVSPDTLLRWHRDLLHRRHAKASRQASRSTAQGAFRPCLGAPARTGELDLGGTGASTANSLLSASRSPPPLCGTSSRNTASTPPERNHTTWAAFLRSPAQAILAADFFETKTLATLIGHIKASRTPARCTRYPHRSPIRTRSPA